MKADEQTAMNVLIRGSKKMKSEEEIKKKSEEEIKKKVMEAGFRDYMIITKWLYDNHKDILREYEKWRGFKIRLEFLK